VNTWNLTITILCLVLGTLMIRREFRRINQHWLWARCIASLLAIVGLGGMGFKFINPGPEKKGSSAVKKTTQSGSKQNKAGFLSVHWESVLKTGQPLHVQGRYKNSNADSVAITLNGFNTMLDSVLVPPGMDRLFTLNSIPKQMGKAVYQLVVNDRNNILETEPVPVVIQRPDSLNLLILSSYPDFENKFLDQWLTNNHIEVVQRTRISRDRFEKKFLNRQPIEFNRISDTLLKQFDLLISDPTSLGSLSSVEQLSIRHQVNENGMGLLVRTDSVRKKKTFYDEMFPGYRFSAKTIQQRTLYTTDSNRGMIYPGNQDLVGIRSLPGTQPLVRDKDGRVLVSSQLEGIGKISFTTLNNTFEWSLAGKMADYGAFWTYLIHKTAKPKKEPLRLWSTEKFPQKDQPVHFTIETLGDHPLEPGVGKEPFYLREQKNLLNEWEGLFWPEQTGWQPAVHAADQYVEWYVYDPKDWSGFSVMEKEDLPVNGESDKKNNALYFLLFFMSGWSFLWIERKLSLI
jgi:hypothetical protein